MVEFAAYGSVAVQSTYQKVIQASQSPAIQKLQSMKRTGLQDVEEFISAGIRERARGAKVFGKAHEAGDVQRQSQSHIVDIELLLWRQHENVGHDLVQNFDHVREAIPAGRRLDG